MNFPIVPSPTGCDLYQNHWDVCRMDWAVGKDLVDL